MSYKKQILLTLREDLGSSGVIGGVRVAHLVSFLCCFAGRRSVSYVPNIATVNGFIILDCHFDFLIRLYAMR